MKETYLGHAWNVLAHRQFWVEPHTQIPDTTGGFDNVATHSDGLGIWRKAPEQWCLGDRCLGDGPYLNPTNNNPNLNVAQTSIAQGLLPKRVYTDQKASDTFIYRWGIFLNEK